LTNSYDNTVTSTIVYTNYNLNENGKNTTGINYAEQYNRLVQHPSCSTTSQLGQIAC